MQVATLLQAGAQLARTKGKRLLRVVRQVVPEDYGFYPEQTRNELSDGTLELSFEDGSVLCLEAHTEHMSVAVSSARTKIARYLSLDLTGTPFWQRVVEHTLSDLQVLVSPYASPDCRQEFGLLVTMSNGETFLVEYISDEEFTDALRIMKDTSHIPQEQYSLVRPQVDR